MFSFADELENTWQQSFAAVSSAGTDDLGADREAGWHIVKTPRTQT